MNDYILLMHNDAPDQSHQDWQTYLEKLQQTGRFNGGSAIGGGTCCNKLRSDRDITERLSGYIRVQAESLDDAKRFLEGNPVYEAGGTVEIRELPRG
jgi:hypothetical protein